jgi:hypothetical protein
MNGPYLQLRAVAAGLSEPALLQELSVIGRVLVMLDKITIRIHEGPKDDKDGFIALMKGLSYCWSVATCAYLMEKWMFSASLEFRRSWSKI